MTAAHKCNPLAVSNHLAPILILIAFTTTQHKIHVMHHSRATRAPHGHSNNVAALDKESKALGLSREFQEGVLFMWVRGVGRGWGVMCPSPMSPKSQANPEGGAGGLWVCGCGCGCGGRSRSVQECAERGPVYAAIC